MKKINFKTIFRLFGFFKNSLPIYIISLLFVSSNDLIFNSISAYSLKGITEGIVNKDIVKLKESVMFIAISTLALAFLVPIFEYIYKASVKKAIGNLRKDLMYNIEKLYINKIENNHSGDFISRLINDVPKTEDAIHSNISMILSATIGGVGSTIFMFNINYKIAFACIILGILNTYISIKFSEPINKFNKNIQESLSRINENLTDTLDGISIIRMFNLHKKREEKFKNCCNETKCLSLKLINMVALVSSVNSFIGAMGFFGINIFGIIIYIKGEVTLGDIIAIIQLGNLTNHFFNSIGTYITNIQGSIVAAERVFYIIDMDKEDLSDNIAPIDLKNIQQSSETVLKFSDINFGYDKNNLILNGVNFSLNKNETMALVGLSGSGKSTIFKILLRFYEEISGKIEIYGKNANEYNLKDLRSLISYVSQDSYLFSGTIAENIGYGKENATIEEIIEAAKISNAHNFINELKDGYNTQVGERGGNLSGGQKQRISIARAVLKNSPILLLDEATSALDSENELLVQDALEKLMKDKSSIVIAHRLSTIKNVDKILLLDNGKLSRIDNYTKLMEIFNNYEVEDSPSNTGVSPAI